MEGGPSLNKGTEGNPDRGGRALVALVRPAGDVLLGRPVGDGCGCGRRECRGPRRETPVRPTATGPPDRRGPTRSSRGACACRSSGAGRRADAASGSRARGDGRAGDRSTGTATGWTDRSRLGRQAREAPGGQVALGRQPIYQELHLVPHPAPASPPPAVSQVGKGLVGHGLDQDGVVFGGDEPGVVEQFAQEAGGGDDAGPVGVQLVEGAAHPGQGPGAVRGPDNHFRDQ